MHVSCILGGHSAFPSSVRNQGFYFSQCRCCGRDMIKSRSGWQKVPKGFRVVWQREPAPAAEAEPEVLIRNLPVPVPPRGLARLALRLAAALDLAGTALRGLALVAGQRLRAWQASLAEPLRPRQLVLRLPAPCD